MALESGMIWSGRLCITGGVFKTQTTKWNKEIVNYTNPCVMPVDVVPPLLLVLAHGRMAAWLQNKNPPFEEAVAEFSHAWGCMCIYIYIAILYTVWFMYVCNNALTHTYLNKYLIRYSISKIPYHIYEIYDIRVKAHVRCMALSVAFLVCMCFSDHVRMIWSWHKTTLSLWPIAQHVAWYLLKKGPSHWGGHGSSKVATWQAKLDWTSNSLAANAVIKSGGPFHPSHRFPQENAS